MIRLLRASHGGWLKRPLYRMQLLDDSGAVLRDWTTRTPRSELERLGIHTTDSWDLRDEADRDFLEGRQRWVEPKSPDM